MLASAFVLVLVLSGQAQAGPGELDPTFSGDGMQTTDFGSGFGSTPDQGSSVAVGPDGKTLVVGATSQPVTGNDFALARYNVDGTLDATFSGDGIQTTNFGTTEAAFAVALAPGGKIVVAGYTHPSDGTPQDYAVARYNADGTLDTTFSDDGKQVTGFGFSLDVGQGVVVAPDGKILVTGYSSSGTSGTGFDFALVRYNADGTLDTDFSGDGRQTTDFGVTGDVGSGVALASGGKIVVAGYSSRPDAEVGTTYDFALARYNGDGTLDTTFSSDGKQTTDLSSDADFASGVAVAPGGEIVVSGSSFQQVTGYDFALVRYDADGVPDTTFSGDGKQTTDLGSVNDAGSGPAFASDGKIVVAGYSKQDDTDLDFALARYNGDGSLDAGFSDDGKQTTDFGLSIDLGLGVAVAPDGKVVVAGHSSGGATSYDFALARYGGPVASTAVAVDDERTVGEDSGATSFDVLSNDTDATGITHVSNPANGSASVVEASPDQVSYTPDKNYCNDPGPAPADTFAYKVTGGDAATVSVTVSCVDDDPVAADDTHTVGEGAGATSFTVLANDSDPENDEIEITGVSDPANGSATVEQGSPDQVKYTPDSDYCNEGIAPTDDFSYTVNGGSSATVSVTVICVDDDPVAADDTGRSPRARARRSFNVLANDTDPEDDQIEITAVSGPANGSASVVQGSPDQVEYTPDPGYCNDPGVAPTDDFSYTVNGGSSATVAVTVTCSGDAAGSGPGNGGGAGGSGGGAGVGGAGPGTGTGAHQLRGTAADDTINGTAGNDIIVCGSGDDVVNAGGGNDLIDCGAGNDRVNGGAGNDTVLGRGGRDRLLGSTGKDTLDGGSGRDRLSGSAGNDTLLGGGSGDRLQGGNGKDRLRGGQGSDWLFGGNGNDLLLGGLGRDHLLGGGGRDVLSGGAGHDLTRQ